MIALFAAFQFLSISPPLVRRVFTPREMAHAVGWFPLVGLALGGVLYAFASGLSLIFPAPIVAALMLAAWLLLTRALHFDGFLDMADGLFGGFTPEKRLEIMRDSRVGAFGVAAGGWLLLVKYAALTSSPLRAGLLLAPLMGRWVLALGIYFYPYARQTGLGRDMKDNLRLPQVVLATAITLMASWLLSGWTGLLAFALAALMLSLGASFILRRIPGLTGDSYGALCELTEVVVLLLFSVSL